MVNEYRPLDFTYFHKPSIFLAGPIQGAPNWQAEAVRIMAGANDEQEPLHIFNPRVESELTHTKEQQILWEKRHLERARDHGAIVFWFAAQDFSIPYPKGRAYAQTTRLEFGRAFGWLDNNPDINIITGIDRRYKGGNRDYITGNLKEHGLKLHNDLGQLCLAALRALTK